MNSLFRIVVLRLLTLKIIMDISIIFSCYFAWRHPVKSAKLIQLDFLVWSNIKKNRHTLLHFRRDQNEKKRRTPMSQLNHRIFVRHVQIFSACNKRRPQSTLTNLIMFCDFSFVNFSVILYLITILVFDRPRQSTVYLSLKVAYLTLQLSSKYSLKII